MKKILYLIIFAVSLLTFSSYYLESVLADMVTFKIQDTRCRPISLSENLDVVRSGNTGRGCTFSLTLTAKGEWVTAGGYYDTPPYAWGGDHFYQIDETSGYIDPDTGLPDPSKSRTRNYSFTCSSPTYTLGNLPSYISLISTENIQGSGTDIAPGKKYTFRVADDAPTNTSFNINNSYQSTCNMISQQDGLLQPVVETNTSSQKVSCDKRTSPININPRGTRNNYAVTISSTACSSSTPTRTPTPTQSSSQPTRTPTPTQSSSQPTRTPTPTQSSSQPTRTPTPTQFLPQPTTTPFHLACSGISCIALSGAGSNSCSPAGSSCSQNIGGSCPNTCGNHGSITQTCICSGSCCPGTCSNGLSCGQTQVATCCNSQKPITPSNLVVTEPNGNTIIQTRRIKVAWSLGTGALGCGNPFGFNCNGDDPSFTLKVDDNSNFSSPIINKTNIPSNTQTYTTTTADGLLTANTTYYVQICAVNYQSTCINTSFVKSAYPPGQISGTVGEYAPNSSNPYTNSGAGSNTISFTFTSSNSTGTTSSCSVTTGGTPPATQSYSCTITMDNVNNDPVPTQNFTLTPAGYNSNIYTGICFQNGSNCTAPTTVAVDFDVNGGSTTNITKNVYFIINPNLSFFKVKNGSVQTHNSSTWSSFFPVSTIVFDSDDYNSNGNYLVIGNSSGSYGGVGTTLFNSSISLGSALTSQKSVPYPPGKNWSSESYLPITSFNSQRYIEYVRTRKEYQTITNLNQLNPTKINVWNTNSLTITDATPFNNKNVVLIVDGTVNFTLSSFTPTSASTAIVADVINFSGSGQFVQTAQGLFIGNTVNLGSSNQPIKIIGNVASTQDSLSLSRVRDDNRKPSLFVVFDINPYINLLSQLSTALYEWKQLQ